MKPQNIIKSIILAVAGIVSFVFAGQISKMDEGEYESNSYYGGDAYTGIQNAGAAAARNVKSEAKIVRKGFASVLIIGGIALIGAAIPAACPSTSGVPASSENSPKPLPASPVSEPAHAAKKEEGEPSDSDNPTA